MKRFKVQKVKVLALIISLTMPGLFAWSCPAGVIRDQAVHGLADAVELTVYEAVLDVLTSAEEADANE